MKIDDEIASRFTCSKCQSHGANVKRFAATGTGISKLLDIQHNRFIAASCRRCGFTEIYNPEAFEGPKHGVDILDVIFGP